jgi:glycosyltransferase involved in cell wall biosynthesis
MKVHILYPFVAGPWGGANQFLKAIRDYLIIHGYYTNNMYSADIILFNSSPMGLTFSLNKIRDLKIKYPNKIFINRIDGPVFFIRNRNLIIDKAFYLFNKSFCDGTIFQSNWSREKNYILGMQKNKFETTVLNASNDKLFNNKNKRRFNPNKKIKIIATSWSSNMKKGFETYKWLDENLDFNKYEMTFVGNSPINFQNIIYKEPMNSEVLVLELKQHDIFITASQSDPCSNSLIEAIHCGLPAIGLNDGGHTEIIGTRGEVFNEKEEIPKLLELITQNYERYEFSMKLPTINEVGKLYYDFMNSIYISTVNKNYTPKSMSYFIYLKIKLYIYLWKLEEKLYGFKNRILK